MPNNWYGRSDLGALRLGQRAHVQLNLLDEVKKSRNASGSSWLTTLMLLFVPK